MATGFYSHPDCLLHDMGPWHPECPARLQAIEDQLIASRIDTLIEREEAPLASEEALARVHTQAHIDFVKETAPSVARHALEVHGLERVAIIDFDVHHGNGTEAAFSGDPRVLMCSFFQHPFYPYSGADSHASNMVNLPMPARTKGMAVREAVDLMWLPRLDEFKPQMIFVSAGFDAHREDDLGNMGLVEDDYTWLTEQIRAVAKRHAKGRIVSSLEGGYNLSALGRSVVAHVRALAEI
jgi:acetoin utilization deacetylase AcuC-like enzyme